MGTLRLGVNGSVNGLGVPLLRVRAGALARLVLASDERACVGSHWIAGRSVLCCSDSGDCGGCAVAPLRVLCYFLATAEIVPVSQPVLVECSLRSLTALEAVIDGSWLGWRVEVSRGGAKRGLVFNVLEKTDLWMPGLSEGWRLLGAIATLYRLPAPGRDEVLAEWCGRTVEARRLKLAEALKRA